MPSFVNYSPIHYSCTRCQITFTDQNLVSGGCPSCQSTSNMYTASSQAPPKVSTAASTILEAQRRLMLAESQQIHGASSSLSSSMSTIAGTGPGNKFEDVLREIVILREDFETEVTEALLVANSAAELQKLMNTLNKLLRTCGEVKHTLQEKVAELENNKPPQNLPNHGPPLQAHIAETFPLPPPVIEPRVMSSEPAAFAVPPLPVKNDHEKDAKSDPIIVRSAVQLPSLAASFSLNTNRDPVRPAKEPNSVDSLVLGKIVARSLGKLSPALLREIPSERIYFPYLSPSTTEDTLRAYLTSVGCVVGSIEMSMWESPKKTRGTATVDFANRKELHTLLQRHDIEIDGWSVSPKLLVGETSDPTMA